MTEVTLSLVLVGLAYVPGDYAGEFDFSLFPQVASNPLLSTRCSRACILEAIQRRYWELENPA
jgi:hypothetical protein